MGHAFNPSIPEAEVDESLGVQGYFGVHNELNVIRQSYMVRAYVGFICNILFSYIFLLNVFCVLSVIVLMFRDSEVESFGTVSQNLHLLNPLHPRVVQLDPEIDFAQVYTQKYHCWA